MYLYRCPQVQGCARLKYFGLLDSDLFGSVVGDSTLTQLNPDF